MTCRTALAAGALVFAFAGGAVHPFGAVKQDTRAPLLSSAAIDATNLDRIQRSCANCHSNKVEWPWYSYVAPTSWLIEKDVTQARAHLNFSRWSEYTTQERIMLLSTVGAVLKTNAMPPQRYTVLHPESALSATERNALYEWAKKERRSLRSVAPEN